MAQNQIKDIELEIRIYRQRIVVAAVFVLLLTSILVARYAYLQVEMYDQFRTQANENRILTEPIPPARGLIRARGGELIAQSRPSYTLSIVPERVTDIDAVIDELSRWVEISEGQRQRFFLRVGERRRPYSPVILRFELSEAEIARVAVQRHRLEGVEVAAHSVRSYPYKELFAHSLGYVGRINER